MSPQYDVIIVSPNRRSGDTVRVDADDAEHAKTVAASLAAEGWTAEHASDASDHGPTWGIDATGRVVVSMPGVAEPTPPEDAA